tara:strand:+ start:265 stop:1305 length:1041 start_codon:yes stop_codon:yes gene_type:complete
MKIAVINDTHFGARNDQKEFLDYFFKFFDEVFFPYVQKNDITDVIHLGDFMDRRKFVNFNTLNQVRTRIIQPLEKMGVKLHCVLGNHDTYYRNTNDVNSLVELFSKYEGFNIIDKPMVLDFEGMCVGLVPWLTKENSDECVDFIKSCPCPILGGHFELTGYEVIRGVKFDGGIDDSIFRNYEMVMSGHFHGRQSKNNVHYLGTQYQITFSDLGEVKGFHVLDTKDRSLTFIENPNVMFHAVDYNDTGVHDWRDFDFSKYEGCYVKIMVHRKTQPFLFDLFVDNFYKANVANLTIMEELVEESKEEMVDMAKDTVTLIHEEIDSLETDKKDEIKKLISDLYMESLSL